MPDLYFLECFSWTITEGRAWQSQLCHSRSIPPPLPEMLGKLVSSILATRFGEMAGKVTWKACWQSAMAYLLIAGLRISGMLKKFWRGSRSTLVRPPEACSWERGPIEIGSDSIELVPDDWTSGGFGTEPGEETTKSTNSFRLNRWERTLVLDYVRTP